MKKRMLQQNLKPKNLCYSGKWMQNGYGKVQS